MLRQLLWLRTWCSYRRFLKATLDPMAAQEEVWARTWAQLSRSEFWRTRAKSGQLEEFDITDYAFYRDVFNEDYGKKISTLGGSEIIFWAESSGTTGKRKLFPLTEPYREQFQTTNLPLVHSLIGRFPGFLKAPILYFAGIDPNDRSPAGVDVGFISNYNYRHIPALARKSYAFPNEVFKDTDVFYEWAPLYAAATDLSAFFSITPARVEVFAKRLAAHWEHYLPYLEGTKQPPAPLPPVTISAERLARLKSAMRDGPSAPFSFREVWPSLQFLCCWKSAACGVQLPILEPYLRGEVPVVDATYSATEGWMNVPLSNTANGGPLHPGAVIVEFFRAGEEPDPKRILKMWQLNPGESYEVLLTNIGGLIRYRLYDVVRCTGWFNRSPIIEFAHKSGSELAIGMTRIGEHELIEALQKSGMPLLGRWVFAPSRTGDGLIFFHEAAIEDVDGYLRNFDAALAALNSYYRKDLAVGTLKPVAAQRLPADHQLWHRAEHAQTKPRPFVLESPQAESR